MIFGKFTDLFKLHHNSVLKHFHHLCGSQQTGKFLKIWEHQCTLPVSCMWVKKQLFEPYMEQLTGSKVGKEYDTGVYC